MRRYRTLALGAAMLALVMSACSPGGSGSSSEQASASETASKPDVSVGSADFYEAAVVAEMYAQALEAKGYTVERHLEIGERPAVHTAMDAGEINLIPEYLGGLAGPLTESAELSSDPQEAWDNAAGAAQRQGLGGVRLLAWHRCRRLRRPAGDRHRSRPRDDDATSPRLPTSWSGAWRLAVRRTPSADPA